MVFIDRNGEFELDEKTQNKYKMFSLYIKEYMKNDVLNSDIIMKSMYEITNHNLTKEEMEKVLEWDKGPKIVIDYDESLNRNGYYDKSTNTIHLNKTNIDRLENALINDKSSDDTKLGALLGTYMTLLHELGHYGEELTHSTGAMHNRDIGYIIQRAIWTGEAHTTKEGLYISKKERQWFFGNTYNLKDNKEIIDKMKQTPEDEKTLPTVPKIKENE